MTEPMNWTRYWATRTESEREPLREIGRRYLGMVAGLDDDGSILLESAIHEIAAWQELENDILRDHCDWLSRTRAKYQRRGWPWTTEELARRSRLWEVGE